MPWAAGAALALASSAVCATNYYVSNIGSDLASGTSATRVSATAAPFATLKALTRLTLKNGDTIFLACGQKFQGPVRLSYQSLMAGTLTLTRYGTCTAEQRPVISGRVNLPALNGAGLKTAAVPALVTQVYSGDAALKPARYPQSGYLIYPATATSSTSTVPANSLLTGKDLLGATLVARTQEWLIEKRGVTSAAGLLDMPLAYALRPKTGAYFTGKTWMIGDTPAWAYDRAAKTVSVRNTTTAPVSVVYDGPLVLIDGRGSLTVSGVAFEAAGADGLKVNMQNGPVVIKDVVVARSGGNGISVWGALKVDISNSRIEESALDGIFFAESVRATVRQNIIVNSGLYLGPGPAFAAINAHRTQGATIENNQVLNSSYIGIRFSGDALVRGNIVRSSCLYISDCAAIYTWRKTMDDVRPPGEVSGNAITDVHGDTTVKFGVNDWFAGIYLDDFSNNVTLRGNVITNAAMGVYLHNSRNNIVQNNHVMGARVFPLVVKDDAAVLVGAGAPYVGTTTGVTYIAPGAQSFAATAVVQRVPNTFDTNKLVAGTTTWLVQNAGTTTSTVAPVRAVVGLRDKNGVFPKTTLPLGCVEDPLGAPQVYLFVVGAQVYNCP